MEDSNQPQQSNPWLKDSAVYHEFQLEREEIMKLKWIESQKAGRDIGLERAITEWTTHHRAGWRDDRRRRMREKEAAKEVEKTLSGKE